MPRDKTEVPLDLGPRIMILGGPASGKSTLARQIGQILHLPVYHMDHIHWLPGWVERPISERAKLAHAIEVSDQWVFEGSLGATNEHRLSRASSVIYLDLPLPLRMVRALRRAVHYRGTNRPDLPEGCPERLGLPTYQFLLYIWRTHRSYRQRMQALFATRPELAVIHLRSTKEVAAFQRALTQAAGAKQSGT